MYFYRIIHPGTDGPGVILHVCYSSDRRRLATPDLLCLTLRFLSGQSLNFQTCVCWMSTAGKCDLNLDHLSSSSGVLASLVCGGHSSSLTACMRERRHSRLHHFLSNNTTHHHPHSSEHRQMLHASLQIHWIHTKYGVHPCITLTAGVPKR